LSDGCGSNLPISHQARKISAAPQRMKNGSGRQYFLMLATLYPIFQEAHPFFNNWFFWVYISCFFSVFIFMGV